MDVKHGNGWRTAVKIIPFPFVILMGAPLCVWTWAIILPYPDRIRNTCDSAVSALFTATDIVSLERSKFLISELRCSIGNRLPQPGGEK